MLRLLLALAALALATFGSGCATHVPMSETLLFHDEGTSPAHTGDEIRGFVFTHGPFAPSLLEAAAERFGGSASPLNPTKASGGFFVTTYTGNKGAVGLTVGPGVLGMDVTAKLWHRNYATVAGSVLGGQQYFLHHRLYNSPRVGLALGAGYRRDAYRFRIDDPDSNPYHILPEWRALHVRSLGTRLTFFYREATSAGVRGSVYAGYTPDLDRAVVSLGFSLGGL